MRRFIPVAAMAGLLAVVAIGAAGITRGLKGESGSRVAAQPAAPTPAGPPSWTPGLPASPAVALPANPDTPKPRWFEPYLEADRVKPRFNQTINGIAVGPTAEQLIEPACKAGTTRQVPIEQAAGTPVMVVLKYLPASASQFEALATVCDSAAGQGTVVSTDVNISVPSDAKTGRRGGVVSIARWQGVPSATVAIPAERWAPGTVGGRPAAIARPILANGLGQSAIVTYANGVTTKVQAAWLTLDEVRRITEGLF